jgi:polyhydroxybutyrate depolymerase
VRHRIPHALVLTLATLAPRATAQVVVDAGRGPVSVHVPPAYDPAEPLPLVVALHGYTATGAILEATFQLTPLADELGFFYVTPDGNTDILGNPYWNATGACCDLFNTNVDDSSYLRALIEEIKDVLTVDRRRVYVVGHSNGGFMAYRMACDHADTIAAVASLAGATFLNPAACSRTEPVHVLQIHGTADTTIEYDGGQVVFFMDPYPGAVQTVQTWATYDGCALVSSGGPNLDLDSGLPGAETTVSRYTTACAPGGSAELWTIAGGQHVPNVNDNFRRGVVEWLFAHPKPVPGTALCFGDGSGAPCPCGNDSPIADESCLHSGGLGMTISGSGSTSLAADDLTVTAHDVPVGNTGIFYAGQTSLAPGNTLFDGLQCAGGSVLRFRGQLASTSEVSDTGFVAQDVFGLYWQAGITYFFQYFTRDNQAGPSPCGGFATLSPSYAVTMTP